MKDKISKFINLQGKYLTSLLFVLLFGVGQMWGVTYTYDFDAATDFTTQTTTKDKNNVTLAQTSYTLNATETGAPSKTFDVVICSVDKNKERSVSYESGKGLKFDRCGALAFSLSEPSIVKILVTSKACVFGKDPAYGTTYTASNYQSFGSNPTTELTAGSEITINCDAGNYKICCPEATGGAYRVRSIKITPAAKVTFDGNGATNGSMEAVYFEKGVATNLPANAFEKSGNDFGGWKDASENTYTDEQSVTLSANLALTAQWVEPLPRYAVKYNKGANGTGTIADGEKIDGTPFTLSSDMFTRESYLQVGWTETDGNARDYMLGGKYTTDAAITLYPAWAQKVTDTYNYSDAKTIAQLESAGWTFNSKSFDSDPTDTEAYANLVSAMNAAGLGAPKTNGMEDNAIAFAKNASAYAMYDLGNATTVSALNVTLYGGSSNAFDQKIEYVAADGSTVLKSYTNSLSAGNWASNSISKTDVIPNVRYIKVYGASKWVVMSAFSVTYGDLSTKYAVNFAKGHADATGTMAAVEYKEGATVTAPACGFERDGYTFSKWSVNGVTGTTEVLKDGTFAMPANTVTLTAQWIETSVTYDITYSSAHGTAPDAANAAMVELAELTESGWQHVGWTADVDVTVDAETVTAGTLIANGKTAILASNVTFTAVWNQIYTVTYNANGGTCATSEATWKAGDDALVLPAATKDNFDFVGWYDAATGGNKIASPYTPSASIELFAHFMPKLVQAIYSNTFDAFIKSQKVNVYYLEGESAPTLTSIKVLGVETPVFEEVDGNIKVTVAEVDYIFPVTKTAVSPYTGTGSKETFDGTETYIKTGNAFSTDSGKEGWKFSKTDSDWSREADGRTRIYFFLGAFESLTFENGGTARNIKVYRNGVELATPTSSGSATIAGINVPAMYAVVSNQTGGDGAFKSVTFTPWVPTTGVALKEGETAISEKEIYAGENFTLTAEVTPANASNKTITWTSSNDAVATVVNGVVTGVAANATPVTITASTVDGVNAICSVTVTAAPEPSADPVITTQPASANYYEGATIAALEVVATGESLTYQWYLGSDAIDGATDATYQPNVSAIGSYVYHCVVTNTETGNLPTSLASNNATITIADDPAAIKLFDGEGNLNTTNFISPEKTTIEISEVEYTCLKEFSSNRTSLGGATPTDMVKYDVTTDKAKIQMTFYNNNSGTKKAILYKYEEGGTPEKIEIEVPGKEIFTTEYYTFNSSKNRSFYVCMNDRSNIRVLQVKVVDNGANPVKQFGQVGYSLNLNKARFYAKAAVEKSFEGFTFTPSSDYKVYNNSNLATTSANSFTIASPTVMSVKRSGGKYYVYQDPTDKGTLYSGNAEIELNATGTWYISSETTSSAASFTKIEFTAPFAATPAFGTMNDVELCAGDPYTAIDGTATVSDGGTVTYKWYAEGDAENVLATTATYTPAADGNYYVVATNSLADHQDKSATSDVVKVEHFASAQITTAPADVLKHSGLDVTLNVVAEGKNVSYEWFTCDDELGANPVAFDPAQTGTSLLLEDIEAGVKYYKVLVTSDCGSASAIAKVEGFDDLPLLNVDGNMKWDFSKANDGTTASSNMCENAVLVNVTGIKNDANFKSQYIMATANKFSSNKLQASMIKFHTTVPGAVIVKFANTSSKEHYRYLVINDVQTEACSKNSTVVTYAQYVPAGDVVLTVTTADEGNMFNFTSVEFKVDNDLEPYRDDEWLAPGELGTICIPQGAVAVGADIYELVGKEPQYGKIVFESVEHMKPGKPYLFQSKGTRIDFILTDEAEADEPDNSGAMKGTFVDMDLTELENVYYFADHALWSCDNLTKLSVPANRAYVKMDQVQELSNPNAAPGRRRVVLGVHGEQVVTGVENLNASEQPVKLLINGQIFILRGEKLFDVTGKLVK